jgi:hypothetical protein
MKRMLEREEPMSQNDRRVPTSGDGPIRFILLALLALLVLWSLQLYISTTCPTHPSTTVKKWDQYL